MARQGIFTGSSPNDGTGDSLVVGAVKVNQNFSEIYTTFGDGNNLVSYANSSGISTYSSISGVSTYSITAGVATYSPTSGVSTYASTSGVATYSPTSGVSTYASVAGYSTSSGIATVAQGLTGTPNINAGIITATSFVGDGSGLTGIVGTGGAGSGVIIKDSGTIVGTAGTIDFGNNLTVSPISAGVVTVTGSAAGGESYWVSNPAGIHTFSNVGIGTTNPPADLSVYGDVFVSGFSTFANNVYIGDGKAISFGAGNDLQILHDGNNSYIDNSSVGNLIIRDSGTGIQLKKTSGALMGVFNNDAGVELYYDGVLKFQTFQNGVAINDSVGIGTTAGNPPYRLTVSGVGATITQGLTNAIADFTSSVNGYGQVNIRNSLSGTNASGDVVITANTGTDISNFINLGINNAGFTTTSWTINGALDGYLYTSDGNLSIGAASASKYLSLFAGGTLAANEQARVTSTGVGIGTTIAGSKLTVEGDGRFSGVVTATSFSGSGSSLTGLTGASANTYGNGTAVPQIVVDSNGRITSITNVAINTGGVGGGGTSGIYVNDGSLVGFAGTIDFGTGLSVTPLFAGIVTANVTYAPIAGYSTSSGVSTTSQGLTGTPNITVGSIISGNINSSGIITAISFAGSGVNLTGIVTSILAGTGVTISGSTGQVTINATGGGGSSQWTTVVSGIITTSNVGIATTNATSALTVVGDGKFTGVVTATRFESSSAGTPTIDSPNNLNINAVIVAISTDLTVGASIVGAGQTINSTGVQVTGIVTATSFVGSGSNITGISTLNIVNYGVGLGGAGVGTDTLQSVTDRGSITTQEITATNFRSNDTVGNGSDIGFATKYYITASGFSAYRFAGPGLVNTTDNPTIYLHRGFTYIFENSTGGSHPFAIRYSSGGTGYGSTYLSGSQTGTQVFTVPFDAPATLVYQCTNHAGMLGTFNIVS